VISQYVSFRKNPSPHIYSFFNILVKVTSGACGVHLFGRYVGKISQMEGPSMLPTLADSGELVFESCFAYRFFPIARGDLVTLKSPLDPQRIVCKRVIGLPGDIICVDPTGEMAPSSEHVVVAKGHVWISGDNAAASRDSRTYGPVSMSLIQAKLVARVWPPQMFRIFRNPTTTID